MNTEVDELRGTMWLVRFVRGGRFLAKRGRTLATLLLLLLLLSEDAVAGAWRLAKDEAVDEENDEPRFWLLNIFTKFECHSPSSKSYKARVFLSAFVCFFLSFFLLRETLAQCTVDTDTDLLYRHVKFFY